MEKTNRNSVPIVCMVLALVWLILPITGARAGENYLEKRDVISVAPSDTTRYGEDGEDDEEDTPAKVADIQEKSRVKARIKGMNLMNLQMENRFVPLGDSFKHKTRLGRFYLHGGVGVESLQQPSPDHHLSPLMHVQFGVGRDFSRLHSLRFMGHGDFGFLNGTALFAKAGGSLDYVFALSSYLSGYNPSRLLSVSTIIGMGGQVTKAIGQKKMSAEGHFGLQFRFYTGPKTYLSLEPYVGLGTDQMDASGRRNWRKIDAFCGVSLNLTYYLGNNLSPESRKRLIDGRHPKNTLSVDSLLSSWQQPWFIQFSNGLTEMKSSRLSTGNTLGSEMTLSIGKWLSPVVGMRGSVFARNNRWMKTTTFINDGYYHPEYTIDHYNYVLGARLDGLFAPLGFLKNFSWDSPFGFYFVAGAEAGRIWKSQSRTIACYTLGWGGGVNLWYQPIPGIKIFAEPRWMYNVYRTNVNDAKMLRRYFDQYLTLNIGVAVELRDHERHYEHSYEDEFVKDPLHRWSFGLAGGTHFLQTQREFATGNRMGWNGMLYGEYHFNRLVSVRLGAEIIQLKRSNMTQFLDYNMEYPEANYAPVRRTGLIDHRYTLLSVSPSVQLDLSYLAVGYQQQRLRAYAFVGPSFLWALNYKNVLSNEERLKANHKADPVNADKLNWMQGAHIGLKLKYQVTRHIGISLTPTAYLLIGKIKMPGIEFVKLKTMETINLGVQYSF